jgi:NodT family efflux transporter outer membrane factor (OMF) lipoprotein
VIPRDNPWNAVRPSVLRRAWIGLLVTVLLGGCTVGPDYKRPETPMPDAWQTEVMQDLDESQEPLVHWWTALGDTTLTNLIRESEVSNLDLASSVARVEEARAIRGIATGGRLPDVVLDGAYARTRISENSATGSIITESGGEVSAANNWDVSLGFSWEIDLFGRIRRQVESATAGLEASIEDYRDVLVSVQAEVAANYMDVRTLQAQLAYARANAEAQEGSLDLTRNRFEAGLTSALDVAQAQSNLFNTQSQIPLLESRLNAGLNRLAVLLGQQPGVLHERLSTTVPVPDPPAELTVGLPADLLRRRPDVRRAERLLAAQTALIGVATADLYPTFSLAGFLGLESLSFDDLFQSESGTWGIVPGFSWNVFSGGKVQNNIRVEEARTRQALLAYEQSVLLALEEVESAMVAYEKERDRRDRLAEAVDATERSVELVRTQYVSGLTNFQNYLDSQRSLFVQQDELARSEGQVVKNLIFLNTALGGGWTLSNTPTGTESTGSEADPERSGQGKE